MKVLLRKRQRCFWFRKVAGICPTCGKDVSYRERVPGHSPRCRALCCIQLSAYAAYSRCRCLEGSKSC